MYVLMRLIRWLESPTYLRLTSGLFAIKLPGLRHRPAPLWGTAYAEIDVPGLLEYGQFPEIGP